MLGYVFAVFAICLAVTVPIGITMGISAMVPHFLNPMFPAKIEFIVRQMVGGVDSTPFIAVPLFVLSGIIMARGGVSDKLFNMFSYFAGDKTGGLPCAVVVTCLFYGAISGSGPATVAAIGAMSIPLLVSLGYDKTFVTALVATAGGLGVIIPPSIPFILYGLSSGVSVGAMFIAGILPGLLIGFCLMAYACYYCWKHGEDKEKLAAYCYELRKNGLWHIFSKSFWALMTPVIILGGIYGGVTTPTEAACVSVVYALIVCCFVYKTMTFKDVVSAFVEAVVTYGPITFILAGAMAFGRVLTIMQAPQTIAMMITGLVSSKIGILIVINLFLLVVGMVIDTSPAILILTPILLPLVKQIGVDPIHFGIIMVVNLAIGFVTPPMGINLFVASSMTGISVVTIARKAIPFIVAFFVSLLLITFIPAISLALL
ncbi:TRAP transporter large permease subunit [Cloacibacillus sp.]|uniref:TRAP transporter large permease n=1 Tax=Cloacibacillus sp. TaxID=2049023 RepID=UPI0025C5C81B|nr:TRAP transporter large permease subunit [Cloacibacillus sp.]MCC8058285.1 TRAP transporter large permease subunit [Cloacibacillus sp.]MCC8178238.1 TRAP transporter large permease subunit [Cloacibacillus sp.]